MENEKNKRDIFLPVSILISAAVIAWAWVYTTGQKVSDGSGKASVVSNVGDAHETEEAQLEEFTLPVRLSDLGARMVSAGVIDAQKLESLYAGRGGLSEEAKKLFYGSEDGNVKINSENSGMLLNLLWALGLSNENTVLENGPMRDPQYGGAQNFASTGGWTLAKGDAMEHYSRHSFIPLTKDEQALVERVARNIYRPCCGNSTYFPDCNHGMAMLGLLELMASQGVNEEEMYRTALKVNSYWFPEVYANIEQYFTSRGVAWNSVPAKEVLGENYSSASGYRQMMSQITAPAKPKQSGSCGV